MKKGFTLGELTITLIIISMVVIVTLPITLNKMKRVENDAYYMGYNAAVDIWANVSENLQPEVTYDDPGETDETPDEPEEPLGRCRVRYIDVGQDDRPMGGRTYENLTRKECDNHAADSCGFNCATDVQWTQYN